VRKHRGTKEEKQTAITNATLVYTEFNQVVSRKILADYIKEVREAIVKGFEWFVPNFGTLKIVKAHSAPKLKVTKEKSFYINGTWYKLDFEPIEAIKREKIECKILPKIKAEVKEMVKNKLIDYRYV
jgi:hypothetical protein